MTFHPENLKKDQAINCLNKEFNCNASTQYDALTSSSNYDSQSCYTARKSTKKAFFELEDTPMSSNINLMGSDPEK